MKFISYNLDSKINPSLLLNNKLALSEQQILELQDLFLTNGFHQISVPSIKEGRSLTQIFLRALGCYQTVGCVSNTNMTLKKGIFDIHNYLLACGYLDKENSRDLARFFIEEFDFDFIWIEKKQNDHWADYFEEKIQEYSIDQQIPIVILLMDA